MTYKDHIKNILREVCKGSPNPGEGMDAYLDRRAEQVLNYVQEVPRAKSFKPKKDSVIED